MKKKHIVIGAILLMTLSLIFPPWEDYAGYMGNDSFTVHGWTYCGYAFVLQPPKTTEEMVRFWEPPVSPFLNPCNVQIALKILALQFLIISLIAFGMIYALTLKPMIRSYLITVLFLALIALVVCYLLSPNLSVSDRTLIF